MSDVIDLGEKRKRTRKVDYEPAGLYMCECGCSMFHLWDDGVVECLNCGGNLWRLKVIEPS